MFALFSTNEILVSLSTEIKKGDVLVVFFASYCAPCKKEIPELIRLHEKYGKGFNILLVNIDQEGKPKAEQFLNEIGVSNHTTLLDIYQQAAKKYLPKLTIPAFFLVGRNGRIKYESIGYKPESIDSFEKYINSSKR